MVLTFESLSFKVFEEEEDLVTWIVRRIRLWHGSQHRLFALTLRVGETHALRIELRFAMTP